MVSVERGNDCGLIRKGHLVIGIRREKSLQESSSRVENGGTLAADLHTNMDLLEVDEVRLDTTNPRGRIIVEVDVPQRTSKLMGLHLEQKLSTGSIVYDQLEPTSPSGVLSVERASYVIGS